MPKGPHLTQPGTARITIHALDEETAVAVGFALAEYSNVTGPSAPYRIPGEDGVCVRMYGSTLPTDEHDTRRALRHAQRAAAPRPAPCCERGRGGGRDASVEVCPVTLNLECGPPNLDPWRRAT
ncbi:DUF6207 family protein [Streptomyces mirabilis]|uniref:DUF6207 family protein n=1 Tax=Streptomyces mirabilis TaxID=68239 RepID=UPI00338E6D59